MNSGSPRPSNCSGTVTAGVPTALCSGVIDKYSVYDRPVPARSSADGIPARKGVPSVIPAERVQ